MPLHLYTVPKVQHHHRDNSQSQRGLQRHQGVHPERDFPNLLQPNETYEHPQFTKDLISILERKKLEKDFTKKLV